MGLKGFCKLLINKIRIERIARFCIILPVSFDSLNGSINVICFQFQLNIIDIEPLPACFSVMEKYDGVYFTFEASDVEILDDSDNMIRFVVKSWSDFSFHCLLIRPTQFSYKSFIYQRIVDCIRRQFRVQPSSFSNFTPMN